MLNKIIKKMGMPFIALLFSLLVLSNQAFSAESESATIHIDIDFLGNLLFDKYDINLYIDDQLIATLPHGTDYKNSISSTPGQHTLWFSNTKKPNIQWAGSFPASEETRVSAKVLTHGNEIEVQKFEFFDVAAYKAEQARQREIQKAKEEEQKKKRKLETSLITLRNMSKVDDPAAASFVEEYKDQTIEIDGNILATLSIDGVDKYLFRAGDNKSYNDKGADFVIDIPPEYISASDMERQNVKLTGTVKGYDEESHRIIMETHSLSTRVASTMEAPDTASPKIIKAVQEALNAAGYDCGKPDGVAGKRTYAAINAFKQDNNLIGEAGLDTALLAALRISRPKEEAKPVSSNSNTSANNSKPQTQQVQQQLPVHSYILNKNTGKFHYPYCSSVSRMKESNKIYYDGTRQEVINRGYVPCGNCHP